MGHVIDLSAHLPPALRPGPAALLDSVARHRRDRDDVFWMKEAAELLNVLDCTATPVAPSALEPFAGTYAEIETRMGFFPQYYRFLLSIALDLEDLGLPGDKAEAMAAWAARQGLARAELSDLQRAEARRLMARRGIDPLPEDRGLEDRVRGFTMRTDTFALPNRKAAYELTHAVFYLGEYGRRDPDVAAETRRSLTFAGLVAFLDRDADLLAEICIALRQAGETPPVAWEAEVARAVAATRVRPGVPEGQDLYHEYLVGNWMLAARGGMAFAAGTPPGPVRFARDRAEGALRPLSMELFALGARSPDWTRMRDRLMARLPEPARAVLAAAEASTPHFAAFFEAFARAEPVQVPA